MTNETQTVETSDEGTETKRTRYSGPVSDLTSAFGGDEEFDITTSGLGRGRPAIDLEPYKAALVANHNKNAKLADEKKRAMVFTFNTDEVSTQKSRFNSAAAEVKVGVMFAQTDKDDGTSLLRVIAKKRLEGRGRKPASNGQGSK